MTKDEQRTMETSCVLGIAPSSRGFGYAVMNGRNGLLDWGVKTVKGGDKNDRSLSKVSDLIELYWPDVVVLEKRRASPLRDNRIETLLASITEMAKMEGIKVRRASRSEINLRILRSEDGTRHQIAERLSVKYPEQLGFRLPKKRRVWMSEPYQMDIFNAVALAGSVTCRED